MGSVRGAAGALVLLAALSTTSSAQADGARCTAVAEDGQRARAAGQLLAARRLFLECSREDCPGLVRADCAQWATSVAESIPSIVIDARDSGGKDVGDVAVSVDDAVVTVTLDGKAIPVDPGPHTLVFARAGSPPITEKVIIKEGARGRVIVVRFGGAPASDATPAAPARDDATAAVATPRGHTGPPWVVVGVGTVIVGTGLFVWATTPSLPPGCNLSTSQCTLLPGENAEQLKVRQDQAGRAANQPTLAAFVIGGGALTIAGGLLWHFLERTGPDPATNKRGARVVPWSAPNAAGISAVGTF